MNHETLQALLDNRPCTCHPDDNPPRPCARRYSLTECREAAAQWPTDAPEWANYMATDGDGQVAWYEHKPYEGNDVWCWSDGKRLPVTNTIKYWRDSLTERPKPPAVKKIDWSKLNQDIRIQWGWFHPNCLEKADFPSRWFAWNCDDHTRGNPLPDGLVVEWFYNCSDTGYSGITKLDWDNVTRFRIVGIQEGWE
jgi:hypothetical protein